MYAVEGCVLGCTVNYNGWLSVSMRSVVAFRGRLVCSELCYCVELRPFTSFFFLMIRRPPRSTPLYSSAASDVYKRQVLIGWSMLFGGLLMTPIAAFNLPDSLPNLNSFFALLWLSVVSTGIGYLGYIRLIDRIGAVKTSTLTYLLPVFSILWGAIFLQEQITLIILGGFLFVMMGMYFANTQSTPKIKN